MKYRVEITDEAMGIIRAQARYIAQEGGAPLNAARWLNRVFKAVETLEEWPRRCPRPLEDAFFKYEVRALSVDGFLLLFTVDDEAKAVRVLSARHGRQLPMEDLP